MKKIVSLVLAALMLASVLAGCGSSAAATPASTADAVSTESTAAADTDLAYIQGKGKMTIGYTVYEPMNYTDESGTFTGFDTELATAVCEKLGVEPEFVEINWDTKETELAAKSIDCIWNGMSINASRQEQMNLSDPYMKNEMVFVVPASSDAASMTDLTGMNIGVQNGSSAQEILEASELYTNDTPITVTAMATNVEALQQMELGLVDAVFLDSVVANYEISSSGKDYRVLPDGLEEEEYAIGFRKEDQALRDEVQKILGEMKADGKLGEISTKWFGSDITTVEAAQ